MQPLLAVARLTLKAAFRYKLVQILIGLLLVVVITIPVIIKHDGSAQGFTQILITYTLSSITAILGFATLWIACGSLAREVEDFSMQLVCSKPIPRWQIWLGKWAGIVALDGALLVVCGFAVFALLQWKANSLKPEEQEKLRREVLVARNSVQEVIPSFEPRVQKMYEAAIKKPGVSETDHDFVKKQIRENLKQSMQYLRPGQQRRWVFELGSGAAERLKDKTLNLRTKIYGSEYSGSSEIFDFGWEIGPSENHQRQRFRNSFGAESFVTFDIEPNHIAPNGTLTVDVVNLNEKPVLFTLEEGLEVLYPVGTFGGNFARGVVIVWCWLGLLAAVGLFAASKLQFNVAAFVSFAILVFGLSSGTLKQVVEQGGIIGVSNESGTVVQATPLNQASVMVYGSLKWVIDQVTGFDPVDALSTGRNITWARLGRAVAVVIGLAGGLFAGAGIFIFSRRELAAPQ
jgi:ABC-type transport system involved in multi-copper enzyme maturation permease subunit